MKKYKPYWQDQLESFWDSFRLDSALLFLFVLVAVTIYSGSIWWGIFWALAINLSQFI